jgi:hypothetical protein
MAGAFVVAGGFVVVAPVRASARTAPAIQRRQLREHYADGDGLRPELDGRDRPVWVGRSTLIIP